MQAVELHRREVRSLLSQRGRDVYLRACEHLTAIRRLLREAGRDDEWQRTLETIQAQVTRLPACKDEMRKAGLI